jgi:hypothetical protein
LGAVEASGACAVSFAAADASGAGDVSWFGTAAAPPSLCWRGSVTGA